MSHQPTEIVLASGNAGKIREIGGILSLPEITLRAQADFDIESPEETGQTFIENALLKARFAAAACGLPAISDDSGLSVDALNGRPGVWSARYAGNGATDEENVDKLLQELHGMNDDNRAAGFHCAAVLVFPLEAHAPVIATGIWRGRILRERAGAGGFGYDPVFLDVQANKTGAQMSREEKSELSHRGKAFRALRQQLLALDHLPGD